MKNLLVVIAISVCIYFVKIAYWSVTDDFDDAYTDDPVAMAAEEDAWVAEELAEGGPSDAAHWLKQKGNTWNNSPRTWPWPKTALRSTLWEMPWLRRATGNLSASLAPRQRHARCASRRRTASGCGWAKTHFKTRN